MPEANTSELERLVARAIAALDGDSNDAEHDALRAFVEYHYKQSKSARLIRVFMEGGLIQAVTGLPPGSVLRKIDLDVEGSLEEDTHALSGDDVPPYCDRETREADEAAGRAKLRAFIGEFLPDGEQRPFTKQTQRQWERSHLQGSQS